MLKRLLAALALAGGLITHVHAQTYPGTPSGTTCPSALPLGQAFANTTGAPTGTTLNIWDGAQCVPWATLNQSQHYVSFQFPNAAQTASTSLGPFTWWNINASGTVTGVGADGITAAHLFNISDTIASGNFGLYNGYWGQNLNSTSITGGRTNLFSFTQVTSRTGNTVPTPYFYVSHAARAQATVNDGGTGGTPSGSLFAGNDIAQLTSTATNWNNLVGREVDCEVDSTASVAFKQCLKVVLFGADATKGSSSDYLIGLVKQSTATGSTNTGITFGEPTGWWPIATTGTIIGTQTSLGGGPSYSAALGIDFSAVSFSTGFLKSNGFLVDGNGLVTTGKNGGSAGTVNFAGSTSGNYQLVADATAGHLFVGSAAISANNVGNLALSSVTLNGATSGAVQQAASATGGHLNFAGSGSAPTLTAGCNGAGSAISGTDIAGQVGNQTAAATSCTVTFGTAYAAAPFCVVSGQTTPVTTYTPSTGTLVINFASTASAKFNWVCYGA